MPHVTVECCRESGHEFLEASIDLKKTFNFEHHGSLWEILRLVGIPTIIFELIAIFCIWVWKCGGGVYLLPRKFMIEAGLCSCFNNGMDWLMGRAAFQSHCRATLDFNSIDDVAILSKSLETQVAIQCI